MTADPRKHARRRRLPGGEPGGSVAGVSTLLSIGDAAGQSGISVPTIRMWEKRFGRPIPLRLPSGHRRYALDDVRWLRRVSEAMSRGVRVSRAVMASPPELEALAGGGRPGDLDEDVRKARDLVRAARGPDLLRAVRGFWRSADPFDFAARKLEPLMEAVGRGWADGALSIGEEHLATHLVEDALRSFRLSLRDPGTGRPILLATLPGERHGIGLETVALLLAASGYRPAIVGVDVPVEEIVTAAGALRARVVGVSVSLATAGPDTDRALRRLRAALPEGVRLVAGGAGARGPRRGPRGVECVRDPVGLRAFVAGLAGR